MENLPLHEQQTSKGVMERIELSDRSLDMLETVLTQNMKILEQNALIVETLTTTDWLYTPLDV